MFKRGERVAILATVKDLGGGSTAPKGQVLLEFEDKSTAWVNESQVTYSNVEHLEETPA